MAPNKYVQYLIDHRIDDGLLKEFLHSELITASISQIKEVLNKEKAKVKALEDLLYSLEKCEK